MPPFTPFNPDSPKWGGAGGEERGYQDGWGEKVKSQSDSRPESGAPPQMEGGQRGEETARQQGESGKKEKIIREERRPPPLPRTKGMPYGGEAKIRGSPVSMGSPPDFLAFDPESPKWGEAEAGEMSPQSGEQSKENHPAGGGARQVPRATKTPGLKSV